MVCTSTDSGSLGPLRSPRRVVVDLENPCAALCTNNEGNLLAVVGRKGGYYILWGYIVTLAHPLPKLGEHSIRSSSHSKIKHGQCKL